MRLAIRVPAFAVPRLRTAAITLGFALFGVAHAEPARDGFSPAVAQLSAVPRYQVDGASLAVPLLARAPRRDQPLQIAVGVDLPLELTDGVWTTLDDGGARWQARVASPGARLLAVRFDQLQLPPSAKLYLYDAAGSVVQGPFTAAQVHGGGFTTPVVPGDDAVLEVQVDSAERDAVQLRLARVYHGYRGFPGMGAGVGDKSSPITGDSAAFCETNVICPAGDNWRSPIRAAGLLQVGDGRSIALCTGDLVNNVRQDDTPYFLTAHHCGIGNANYSAAGVVIYWNFQASSCTGTSGSLTQNQTGSTLEATDAGSDFTLIKLDAAPNSSYSVYFAGWDVSSAIASSGVGIHHPVADIKKISTYSTPVSRQTIQLQNSDGSTEATVQAWQVTWSSGITEEGSSGSGLWNQNSRIVGVLSGGDTACSSGTSSTGNDYYGRLEVAWQASTTASGQLKAWLDPDNTGTLVLNGKDPGATGSTSGGSSGGTSTGTTAGGSTGGTTTGGTTTGGTTGGGTTTGGTTTGSTTGSTTTGGTSGHSSGGSPFSPFALIPLGAMVWMRRRAAAKH